MDDMRRLLLAAFFMVPSSLLCKIYSTFAIEVICEVLSFRTATHLEDFWEWVGPLERVLFMIPWTLVVLTILMYVAESPRTTMSTLS